VDRFQQLIIMFGRDTQRVQVIRSFLGELVCRTMSANDVLEKAEQNGDLLKSVFLMLAQIMKKNSTLLLTSDGVNMESVFQWGKKPDSRMLFKMYFRTKDSAHYVN